VPAFPELRLPVDLPRLLREMEEAYIRMALDQTNGNKKEAARLLGMGRTTLVEKLRRKAAIAIEKSADDA
jgi:DNA-binding NtrC family response regulator